jgi:glutamine synthetase
MNIGAEILPKLPRDATDRNRTSPFAFTGNKFEFRAVGSSHSCADANIVLNTIVAESLDDIATKLEKLSKKEFDTGLRAILTDIVKKHKRIIFNGDNYSDTWLEEAKKRGLPNYRTTPEALSHYLDKENKVLFDTYNVLNEKELKSRYEVASEEYANKIDIEGRVLLDIAKTVVLPAAVDQLGELAHTYNQIVASGTTAAQNALQGQLEYLGTLTDTLTARIDTLQQAVDAARNETIIDSMNALRETVDALECIIQDSKWPLPKYQEMLFAM